MRRWVVVAVAAMVVTGAGVAAGTVLLDVDGDSPGATPFSTTPLESFDTSALTVPRASFCDAVDPRQVEAALGDEPVDATSYENGEEVTLADGVTDVAHEFGCTWTAGDGTEARAWVFAPPVDPGRAQTLVDGEIRRVTCDYGGGPAYGDPSLAMMCVDDSGTTASYRGLFGDAWLTCELTVPEAAADQDALRERTGRWCVGVAMAASSGGPRG
jgi:hypothetical protein